MAGKGKRKIATVMGEFKRGTLHSGKSKKIVKSRPQAVAIALSEAREAGANIPRPKERRGGSTSIASRAALGRR